MADTNETSAGVIAAMRGGPIPQHRHDRVLLCHFADRFEAAHRRDCGDAAKLREAVKKVLDAVKHLSRTHSDDLPEDVRAVLGSIAFDANAALSASPRNCYKYANHNDAMKAFESFVREQGKLGFMNSYTEAFKWLFAPATEKEGGKDADQ